MTGTGWTARTGGVDGESGGRLEVRMGERRQTLGFFQWQREMLNCGLFNEDWYKKGEEKFFAGEILLLCSCSESALYVEISIALPHKLGW